MDIYLKLFSLSIIHLVMCKHFDDDWARCLYIIQVCLCTRYIILHDVPEGLPNTLCSGKVPINKLLQLNHKASCSTNPYKAARHVTLEISLPEPSCQCFKLRYNKTIFGGHVLPNMVSVSVAFCRARSANTVKT